MLLEYLYDKNPFDDFPIAEYAKDVTGFRLPESVLAKVAERRPKNIIEVGTWKGRSAIFMADLLEQQEIDAEIVCVDTWLGAQEMWRKPQRIEVPERYAGLNLKHGYPQVYYQFLANVIFTGHQKRIVPLPNSSLIAARLLSSLDYKADVIFIDGSHDYDDVLSDLVSYWRLLRVGGVLMGDDFDWVGAAVREFARGLGGFPVVNFSDEGWIIEKSRERVYNRPLDFQGWVRRNVRRIVRGT